MSAAFTFSSSSKFIQINTIVYRRLRHSMRQYFVVYPLVRKPFFGERLGVFLFFSPHQLFESKAILNNDGK